MTETAQFRYEFYTFGLQTMHTQDRNRFTLEQYVYILADIILSEIDEQQWKKLTVYTGAQGRQMTHKN